MRDLLPAEQTHNDYIQGKILDKCVLLFLIMVINILLINHFLSKIKNYQSAIEETIEVLSQLN